MSYADHIFVNNCINIIEDGISDEQFEVRPKWHDGTPAHTQKIMFQQNRYQLSKDSIPVMTLRKIGLRNCVDEILWIYQKQTSDISQLHSHIWDDWNVGDGTIGKAYGYQIGKESKHHKYHKGEKLDGIKYHVVDDWVYLTQTDAVLWDLMNNPGSRSIMTNTYNHEDLAGMGLRPCAYSMHFLVTKNSDGQMVLNGKLLQRSQDMLTANNWNVVQYSILLQMFAQVTGMIPGLFVHEVSDMHIYDRHIPLVEEMIEKYRTIKVITLTNDNAKFQSLEEMIDSIPYPNPTFWINPDVKNFYDFKVDDFRLDNYRHCEFNHKIEVAI